jgi:outer membrane protein OmpA-like peptidoglycan-associated protein
MTTLLSKGMRAGLACLAVAGLLGITGGLSGCKSQKRQEAAMQEASELRERTATLEQANRDKDARIAELETRLAGQGTGGAWGQPTEPIIGSPTGLRPENTNPLVDDFVPRGNGEFVATLAGNVLFDSGQAQIKSSARKQLDSIANALKGKYAGASVRVEGHTDSDPIKRSKWGTNEALSQARAEAVAKYLAAKGVSSSRLEAMGMGSAKPKSSKAASRRVEVVVMTTR